MRYIIKIPRKHIIYERVKFMKKLSKCTRKILSVLLTTLMVLAIFTVAPISANSANTNKEPVTSGSGVQDKLNTILSVYPTGSYFTASGRVCNSDQANDCKLSNIPSRGGLPSGATVVSVDGKEAWSCCAFAKYIFYCTFGISPTSCGTVNPANAQIGDYIEFKLTTGKHFAIYLGQDANYWYVYDSNFTSTPTNIVKYNRAISKSSVSVLAVYRASNYNEINNSGKFDFWGHDLQQTQNVSGTIKLWFKAINLEYSNSDVNVYIDNVCIGTIYPDKSGYYSININTCNYKNGVHKVEAVFRNTLGIEKYSSTLYIDIRNASFLIWDIPQGEITGYNKLWFKVNNCDYTNS